MAPRANAGRKKLLFSSKTTPPKLPIIITRKRCLNVLANAKDHKIIYISGRAGQGKTTLALSWLKETRAKMVWLTLDEGDNDLEGFFRLMEEGFSVAFPRIALDLLPVPTGAPYDPDAFARTYFRSLFSRVPVRYTLVLDEFHFIKEDGQLYPVLEALIEALPPNVRLIFLSRSAPPPFMARWIASRQLLHISEDTLRFSNEETMELFTNILKIPITPPEAEALNKIADGWAIGLVFMQEKARRDQWSVILKPGIQLAGDDTLNDYLYHEIYRRFPLPIQDLMVKTSLFDAFSLDSACRLIPRSDILSQIRFLMDYLLLSETDSGDKVLYQYHPLMRQFLRARAMALSEEERHKLVSEIGLIHKEQGEIDQGIDLYLVHGHYEDAIRLIEQIGLRYTFEGRHSRLGRWIRSMPAEKIEGRPWLQFFLASDQAFTDPLAALSSYDLAFNLFEQAGDTEGQLWALSSKIFLEFFLGQDYRPLKADAKKGRDILLQNKSVLSPLVSISFLIAESISEFFSMGNPQQALKKALDASELARKEGLLSLYVRATMWAVYFALYCGKFHMSSLLAEKAEKIIPWDTLDPVIRVEAFNLRSIMESFSGKRERSLGSLNEANRLCMEYGLISMLPMVQCNLLRQRIIAGGVVDRSAAMESMLQLTPRLLKGFVGWYLSYCEAIILLRKGELPQAHACIEEAFRMLEGAHIAFFYYINRMMHGVILGEIGEVERAEQSLLQALSGFEKAESPYFAFWAHLSLSKLFLEGEEKKAKKHLSIALQIGKKEGYQEGEWLTQGMISVLISRARQWGLEPNYVNKLMQHWMVTPTPVLSIYTFGRFEMAVYDKLIPEREWHGKKTRLFLIALLYLCGKEPLRCGKGIPKEDIIDLLWSEADGDCAITSFHTTLHRLQAVLRSSGITDLIQLKDGQVFLNQTRCQADCCAFERVIRQAKLCEAGAKSDELRRYLEEAKALHQGEYLPMFRNEAWIETKREALQKQSLWVEQRLKDLS